MTKHKDIDDALSVLILVYRNNSKWNPLVHPTKFELLIMVWVWHVIGDWFDTEFK